MLHFFDFVLNAKKMLTEKFSTFIFNMHVDFAFKQTFSLVKITFFNIVFNIKCRKLLSVVENHCIKLFTNCKIHYLYDKNQPDPYVQKILSFLYQFKTNKKNA